MCTHNHFPSISVEQFNKELLNNSYCLPKNYNATIQLNSQIQKGLEMHMVNCDIENNPDCIDLRNNTNY